MARGGSPITLDPQAVRRARQLARRAALPVVGLARNHTTVSVERATLRLAGLTGADAERVPWVNHLVDGVRAATGLEHGVTLPVWDALARAEAPDLLTLAQKAATGGVGFRVPKDATRSGPGGSPVPRSQPGCVASTVTVPGASV